MLLFLVLAGNSALLRFLLVTRSYSSRPFLCTLVGADNALSGQYSHRQILLHMFAELRASNSSLQTLYMYVCKLQLCKAALDSPTSFATGEEESTVTHGGSVTPRKRITKAFILRAQSNH